MSDKPTYYFDVADSYWAEAKVVAVVGGGTIVGSYDLKAEDIWGMADEIRKLGDQLAQALEREHSLREDLYVIGERAVEALKPVDEDEEHPLNLADYGDGGDEGSEDRAE